jgi:hypothetical protein
VVPIHDGFYPVGSFDKRLLLQLIKFLMALFMHSSCLSSYLLL